MTESEKGATIQMMRERHGVGLTQFAVLLSALSFVWMGMVVPDHHTWCGDANGDHQINILDVQTLISEVMDNSHLNAQADVNADGEVNILDLQYTLSHKTQSVRENQPAPSESKPAPAVPMKQHRQYRGLAQVPQYRIEVAHLTLSGTPRRFSCTKQVLPKVSSRTERYLFNLTPHAPPLSA